MAHYPADTFQEATEIAIEASNQLHSVINGDANAEVIVEDGSKIPSVRKAMVDSLYFKPPIAWAQGEYEDTYNQLREFVDGDVRTWWFAKGATVSTPVLMTTNPATDPNWTLWGAVTLNAATYETQKRLAAEAGLNMVGSFLLGGTVTNVGDVVFCETDGKYYGWGGSLPKTVTAGSTPATAGGVGVGLWADKTDLMLRSDLSKGALLVRSSLWSLRDFVSVKDFGAIGDGIIDDTLSVNAAYNTARSLGYSVVLWPAGTYKITGQINATSVSTIGNSATFLGVLSSAISGSAFSWGGNNCYVTGMVFDLSNSNTEVEMQGVFNSVNNVSLQRFFNNSIVARTSKSTGASNIYGAWFTGTGLKGLQIYGNTIDATSYGIQLNNQDPNGRDVNTNPLGSPTYDVFIHDNNLIDCALGVNTPHIFCFNAQVHNNTLRQVAKSIDLPLNIAHVTGLVVAGNNISCNVASSNGALHIEDVSQTAVVCGNVINTSADNHGIYVGVASGVSQDNQPTSRIAINSNTVQGYTSSGTKAGILLSDIQSYDNHISGNHISNFGLGMDIVGDNSIVGNTIINCGTGLVLPSSIVSVTDNIFKGCSYIARNTFNGAVCISGGFIVGDSFAFDKQGLGVFLISNVTLKRISTTTFSNNIAFNLIPLPVSGQFTGSVNILFSSMGFSKHTFTFDGTTFAPTRVANAQLSSLGGLTLSKNGDTLQAVSSVASGTASIMIQMDGLVY